MTDPIPWDEVAKGLAGKEIPAKVQITINLEQNLKEDVVWLTECVDPLFDLSLVAEALATSIAIAAAYTGRTPENVLEEVVNRLTTAVKWHGKIRRKK